ncbi:MAG TPA: hypothetical protein VKU41_15895 [Polyangiaceae bacterium]|nr:hypothetical protein [Polyangiaceae bacterium]
MVDATTDAAPPETKEDPGTGDARPQPAIAARINTRGVRTLSVYDLPRGATHHDGLVMPIMYAEMFPQVPPALPLVV